MSEEIVRLEGIEKIYQTGDTKIVALSKTDLSFHTHRLTLIMGPSGSGKTTLLSILGMVIYPTNGNMYYRGRIINGLTENQLASIRLKEIGFVFQQFNLLDPLNAVENVMQPLLLQGLKTRMARDMAVKALDNVGLLSRARSLPKELSGGQKQRVAIARSLVTSPSMILCDEPTASLDAKSAVAIMSDLQMLARAGKAVIVVSHDLRLKKYADQIVYVEEGMVSDKINDEDKTN
ncbi:ABC transporter ATP-binding protein [Sphingobacterium sp. LRF_L2]|uniref:ABC transporter ATP-binding protein n=1 Tax=Sphingobacterium sp. LRF_L2 TaxID=3369421 RepID=UPI003F5FCAB0